MVSSQDENWRLLGLTDIAVAASLRNSALMPLQVGGSMVGYFQVSHHRRGPMAFSDSELRLMNIVGNQAAAIIENAILIQQNRLRTQRSDVLSRMVSVTDSSSTLDDVLKYSVQELTNLFQAEAGAVFLSDETRGQLKLHRASVVGSGSEVLKAFAEFEAENADYHSVSEGPVFCFWSSKSGSAGTFNLSAIGGKTSHGIRDGDPAFYARQIDRRIDFRQRQNRLLQ